MDRFFIIMSILLLITCSKDKNIDPQAPPDSPQELIGQAMSASVISLSWVDASSNETGFVIYRQLMGIYYAIDTVPADQYNYHDIGLDDSSVYSYYVTAINRFGESNGSNVVAVTTLHSTEAPYAPSDPIPADYSLVSGVNVALSWYCHDPNNDELTYSLCFGISSDPPLLNPNLSQSSFDPGALMPSTTYFWKVAGRDPYGNETWGPLWRFTTGRRGNLPPDEPSDPSPPDGSADIGIDAWLSWHGSDPDNDQLTYDVYFGLADPPPFVRSQQSTVYNPPGHLYPARIYHWRIVARDEEHQTSGPLWKFLTYPGL